MWGSVRGNHGGTWRKLMETYGGMEEHKVALDSPPFKPP
jgi:hypothetical protein